MPDRKKIDDLKRFYRACNPARTLDYSDPEDRRYYIDFTEVRSGNMIREFMRTITFSDDPTCQLFSGHIGCGKSTELLRLKAELEADGYHVVYFVSSEDLDMGDVDITDILFVITRKISDSPNLDRIHDVQKTIKHTQSEYIFFDRGEQLKALNCHLVYTIPLTLIFANDASVLASRFGVRPKVLSMVPTRHRDGRACGKGLRLLKEMALARTFRDLDAEERLASVDQVFQEPAMLERLCEISGGHVRNLLGFLFSCLQKEDPPFSRETLEEVVKEATDDIIRKITQDEWDLLRRVVTDQKVAGEEEHDTLLRGMFVFEYHDPTTGCGMMPTHC